ncbi:MAG TPA: 3-methyl-2-oxobutanoate hydroxymethyltransferase [Polyangiaceae bacterium]|nr:3-methyl-2-oxobutanoate hydroxymethyltransferase [Polyangiaceae bacterium]
MVESKVLVPELRARKRSGPKIVAVTAYDATLARLLDAAGVDVLLIGDSLGMVVQGLPTTLPVTLEEVAYHCRAVARAARRAQVVGDLPFMSYQTSPERAVEAAGRLVKEGNVEAVKLEGGLPMAEHVRRIVEVGIPVMGHVGLTPQSVHAMGGFRVQGKTAPAQDRILADARALEAAGAYSIVVEGVPAELGRRVTESVSVPTIGIGAGPHCDGQVLVCYDLLGMYGDLRPKFVKRYAELGAAVVQAVETFAAEVRSGAFPSAAHSFGPVAEPSALAPAAEPTGSSPIVTGEPTSFAPAGDDDA